METASSPPSPAESIGSALLFPASAFLYPRAVRRTARPPPPALYIPGNDVSAQSSIDTVRAGSLSFDTGGYRSDGDRALSPSPLSPPPPAPAAVHVVLMRAGGACDGTAPFRTSVRRGGVLGASDVPTRRLFAFRWGGTRAEVRHGTVPGGGGGRVEREGWATIGEALDGDEAGGSGRGGGDVGDGGDAYAHALRPDVPAPLF